MDNRLSFTVRNVREEDAASITAILNPIVEAGTYTIIDEPCSIDNQIDFIRGLPERSLYNIAICSHTGNALGIQDVVPVSPESRALRHVGEISTFVALDKCERGIGSGLMETTCREALSLGFFKIMAMIRADNTRAIWFYRGQGFNVVGTAARHAYIRGEYIDEVIMERLLQ